MYAVVTASACHMASVNPVMFLEFVSVQLSSLLYSSGTMCYMSGNIQTDNNYLPENDGGVWQWIFGKSISSSVFFNPGSDDGYVGISAPFPGRILPVSIFFENRVIMSFKSLVSSFTYLQLSFDSLHHYFTYCTELHMSISLMGNHHCCPLTISKITYLISDKLTNFHHSSIIMIQNLDCWRTCFILLFKISNALPSTQLFPI